MQKEISLSSELAGYDATSIINEINNSGLSNELKKIIGILGGIMLSNDRSLSFVQGILGDTCKSILGELSMDKIDDVKEGDERIIEVLVCNKNIQNISLENEKIYVKCRLFVSSAFHELVHYTTLKSIPRLVVLFYKLVSLELLEPKIVNYFFLCLTTSHENIPLGSDLRTIKKCLYALFINKILYIGSDIDVKQHKTCANSHLYQKATIESISFGLITYVIYFAPVTKQKEPDEELTLILLEKILEKPIEVCSLMLTFRNEFPEREIVKCRNFSSISTSIVDNSFFKGLLKLYFDCQLNEKLRSNLRYIIKTLFSFHISPGIVKNIIKKMEVSSNEVQIDLWKETFGLLKSGLPLNVQEGAKSVYQIDVIENEIKMSPKKEDDIMSELSLLSQPSFSEEAEKEVIIMKGVSSYTVKIEQEMKNLKICFKSYHISEQMILLKLCSEAKSTPNKFEIVISLIYLENNEFNIYLTKMRNGYPIELKKTFVSWNPFCQHFLECQFLGKETKFIFGEFSEDDNEIKNKVSMVEDNIYPHTIIIGSNQPEMLSYSTELTYFRVRLANNKDIDFMNANLTPSENLSKSKIVKKDELIKTMKQMGDLDIFFMIASHLIQKAPESKLQEMLKETIDFVQFVVFAKGVYGVKVNETIRENRFYSVRCLVWTASKLKNAGSILEILRFLSLRGIKRQTEDLEILGNIGLWKDFSCAEHCRIIDRIREICLESLFTGEIVENCMKKIIVDYIIFYKMIQLENEENQSNYLQKHSQILKLVYDCIVMKPSDVIIKFIIFLLSVLYKIIDRSRENDYLDSCIAFHLSTLIYRLFYEVRENQYPHASNAKKIKSPASPLRRPVKTTKPGISSSKSMNLHISDDKNNQDFIVLKIEEAYQWLEEIIFCLDKQVYNADDLLRYYDWPWNYSINMNSSSIFCSLKNIEGFKTTKEGSILSTCEKIRIDMISCNKISLHLLSLKDFSEKDTELFVQSNLFDERISLSRFMEMVKFINFDKIVWDDKRVCKVIERSFEALEGEKCEKLPYTLFESMKVQDINLIHVHLLEIYRSLYQENLYNTMQTVKWGENVMLIISMIPKFLYTNTLSVREELRKFKKNADILDTVENHLIIKEFATEGFKLVQQLKDKSELSSTIIAFDDKYDNFTEEEDLGTIEANSENTLDSQNKNNEFCKIFEEFKVLDVDYQESFISTSAGERPECQISAENIENSLNVLKLLINPPSIGSFYKIEISNHHSNEEYEALKQNFVINIDQIIENLHETNQLKKIQELHNQIYFIDKQILCFSKMILNEHIFSKQIMIESRRDRKHRKNSFKVPKNFQMREEFGRIIEGLLKESRKGVNKMEKVWLEVEKNNKDLWEVFFKEDPKHQRIDKFCNQMKLRILTKVDTEKNKVDLPINKNSTIISNKFSVSADSEKDLIKEGDTETTVFEDIYAVEESSDRDKEENEKIATKKNEFAKLKENEFDVLYITLTCIYQGVIECSPNRITFLENAVVDEKVYEGLCSNDNERRTYLDIEKNREEFTLRINENTIMIAKRYFYHENSVEIYTENQTAFFCLRNTVRGTRRNNFFKIYSHLKGCIPNKEAIHDAVSKQSERWSNGDISNFTYLMHLNDLSGRTFNDMSQYYIFPWILTNYKTSSSMGQSQTIKFNSKFINDEKNYRKLEKPVGALSDKRFDELISRYNESLKYKETESYLYGSFCSNPAIVCNYMLRLWPFSEHHFLLQSRQFDIADRLFYSVLNQWNCTSNNIGDYKELIPEFYSYPEFLRNRNKFKFGNRQNHEAVGAVQLPEWAHYEYTDRFKNKKKSTKPSSDSQVEEKFIFRMRKCLESRYVTSHLNLWIDLTFGQYNQKDKAIQKNNLYISNVYEEEIDRTAKKKEKMMNCYIFYKEFGQMPRSLFDRDHKEYSNKLSNYKINNSQVYRIGQIKKPGNKNYSFNHRYFVYWDLEWISVYDTKSKSVFSEKGESLVQIEIKSKHPILALKTISIENGLEESKKTDLLVYLNKGKLIFREISISTFRKKLEVKEEIETKDLHTNSTILKVMEKFKSIILVEDNEIKMYYFSLRVRSSEIMEEENSSEEYRAFLTKKQELHLFLKNHFVQHRTKVEFVGVLENYGLIISVDSSRKVFVLKIVNWELEVSNSFRMKKLSNCEIITQMEVHELGYLIVLTNLNRIHVYNFMGDYVSCLEGTTLHELSLRMRKTNKKVSEQKLAQTQKEQKERKTSEDDIYEKEENLQSSEFADSDNEEANTTNTTVKNETEAFLVERKDIDEMKCFKIWNDETSEIIIGTRKGMMFRVDLFVLEDSEMIDFESCDFEGQDAKLKKTMEKRKKSTDLEEKSSINFINVNRIGRHWQCWAVADSTLIRIESEDYRNAKKRNEEYRKKKKNILP